MKATSRTIESLLRTIPRSEVDNLLHNAFVQNLEKRDWGKVVAAANEALVAMLLEAATGTKYYTAKYHPVDFAQIAAKYGYDISNGCKGFDILSETGERIQSKLRQLNVMSPWKVADGAGCFDSVTGSGWTGAPGLGSLHFENTRRHSARNLGAASDGGHVRYGKEEFDYLVVSIVPLVFGMFCDETVVKDTDMFHIRSRCERWAFSIIPTDELVDRKVTDYLVRSISVKTWRQFVVQTEDDIRQILQTGCII